MLKNLFKSTPDHPEYPGYLDIKRRKVKWARLQVYANGEVQMVVPRHYNEREIHHFYQQKRHWIEQKRTTLGRPAHEVLGIKQGQLLLFGRGYDWQQAESQQETINHIQRVITSSANLAQRQEQESWYKRIAKAYLTEQIDQLASAHGYAFNRLFIRAQRTRWGSCSSAKNISLNWKLVKTPVPVSDYVILHELAHTRVMNHSAEFWREVERHRPNHREARAWLRQHGAFL